MIRDPGPLHNLGFSVTSRDIPTNAGETEGDAPNSGFIARALNEHPIMRFFATSAATIAGTVVASKVTKKGGLKLAKFVQDSADNAVSQSSFSTNLVKSITDIRRHLDELQGVSRSVDDPYSKIVFEQEGRLTTGLDSALDERRGYGFMTGKERRDAGSNFLSDEPAHVWTFRDELQRRLVRAGRRLPYELPAMYGVQKAIVEPLSGERDESERKVKWYNPVDVVADFTKTSLTNVATMVLPFEFAGAAASAGRSSLHTLRYSMNDMRNLTPYQKTAQRGMREVSDLLAEVGQDFASLTNRFLKTSAQVSGSLSTAAEAYKNQGDFVQNLYSLRHGVQAAKKAAIVQKKSESQVRRATFESIFKGFKAQDGTRYKSIFDLSSTLKGIPESMRVAREDYRILGKAYDALEGSVAYNNALTSMKGMPKAEDALRNAIERIQSQHSSKLTQFASGVRILGGSGSASASFRRGSFFMGEQETAFKDLLEKQLLSNGVDKKLASQFVADAKIRIPRLGQDPTEIISVGKIGPLGSGDEFFESLLQQYKGIKNGKDFASAISANNLRRSVEDARDIFGSRDFQRTLQGRIASNYDQVYRRNLLQVSDNILKPKKANFRDFIDPGSSSAKQDFIRRKTAQSIGIKLVDEDGIIRPDKIINQELAKRGFDPNDMLEMRGFLVRNRKMSAGIFGDGYNVFGLKQVTIGEAMDKGKFSHLRTEEQDIIKSLAARRGFEDPVASTLTMSKLDGVYQTRSGDMLDFTAVRSAVSRVGSFMASELKIPILGFNPADLFGYRSFSEMRQRSPIQYISSRSVQPFLEEGATRPDFYLYARTKGTKGVLTGFSENAQGIVASERVAGLFRALPTSSSDLLTRHARLASGREGMTPDEIRGNTNNRLLNFLAGGDAGKAVNWKRRWSVDSEQPNSLFGALSRFRNRRNDLQNNPVMARILQGENISPDMIDDEFIQAYNSLRRDTFKYGMPTQVMRALEDANAKYFTALGGMRASEIRTPQQAVDFAEKLLSSIPSVARELRSQGVDARPLYTSASRIQSILAESNLNAISSLSQYSPTITTRLDQFRNEIFKYISQSNQIVNNKAGNDIFTEMIRAIDDLHIRGVISASQKTEAQAAGLSTLFNISAFKTYADKASRTENAKAAVTELLSSRKGLEKLFDPFTEGQIAQVSGSIRKKFSPLLGPINKRLGSAGYSPDDLAVDPLGSGQKTTLVPTFGTVFGRDPFGAIANALGFTSYSNPGTFSTGSVPISQGVERLNRYFGSLGMQLDVSDFKGPLDLFARGMVAKRVLPLYAGGTAALTVDRTLGGMANGEDDRGERIYSPLILGQVAKGAVELQALGAGLAPGGMTYQEKREQLLEGEVPIRQGRFWPLGNQPFQGGKVMYYRPSWYRKLQGGAMFTSDTYGSPAEKFLFYNDISPLRPLDPYRFERKHYQDRPYPVTGEYFSGPFGPLVPLANATVGRILKPQLEMHSEEVAQGLANYVPAGQFGAYDPTAYTGGVATGMSGVGGGAVIAGGGSGVGGLGIGSGGSPVGSVIGSQNEILASRAGSVNAAQSTVRSSLGNVNSEYAVAAYGPPKVSGIMNPRIVASGQPITTGSAQFQASELGYRTQEMLGIYGFAFGAVRQGLGFGQSDFEPQRSVLQSASKAYSSSRAFWDLNLGGLGDVPLPSQEAIGNIEFSEIVRRFIPKERSGVDYINPIRNTMGMQYQWLPGSEYYIDFTRGDPFTKVQEGEVRLPGVGYERFNRLFSDETGRYGLISQLDILGDVAPYSQQYKMVNAQINKMNLSPDEKSKVQEIRAQVEDVTTRFNFSEYKYKGASAEEMAMSPMRYGLGRMGEMVTHSDNFVLSKLFGKRTAVEDWERTNVYGATFPEWQRPYESYIEPMLNKATQDNPLIAAGSLGIVGGLFGRTPRARLLGTAVGATAGAVASTFGQVSELITGDRFVPEERKKELALEEYTDILNYVKNANLANQAKAQGDSQAAAQYAAAAGRTMYGMDLTRLQSPNRQLDMISLAVPKRKREHFKAMINAPEEDRERILSTSGRLERRLYQAAWGMEIEKRPELVEYFSRHELPDETWEGWQSTTNIDHVKIKMGQSMGLEMSQMGYYPQQIKEANLSNPSYPDFFGRQDRGDVTDRLRRLMTGMGISGSVTPVMNPFGSEQINVSAGVG